MRGALEDLLEKLMKAAGRRPVPERSRTGGDSLGLVTPFWRVGSRS